MELTDLPARAAADLAIGAFHARIDAIRAGERTFLANVAVQRRDDWGGDWEQVRATRMTVMYPTVATLDMLVDHLLGVYAAAAFHTRVTAAVMDADGAVKIAYGTSGPTWNSWPRTPGGDAE